MAMRVVRTLVFTVLAPGTALIFIPYRILNSGFRSSFHVSWLSLGGLVPIALGASIMALSFAGFVAEGHGTPAPYDPPRRLVTGRLYNRVRNPIYIGVILILLGEAIVFQSLPLLGYAAVAWLVCHLFVVLYEEPGLRRRFGASYEAYWRRTPRWLPRLRN